MQVSEAVARRKSVRAFLDDRVDAERLAPLIERAGRAASGGNLQPWHVTLLTDGGMERFRAMMSARIASGRVDSPEYPVYPSPLAEPYRSRRFAVGEAMYARLGIPREDKAKRLDWFARNYRFFDAPAGLFLSVERDMGAAQWTDLGGFLATLMLLIVEDGLASCPQEAWVVHHRAVADFIDMPDSQMLFCGLAIGHPDPNAEVNGLETARAPVEEWLKILSE
ncbi:MAG: nitroreductase [Pseudomonadota bacterium]